MSKPESRVETYTDSDIGVRDIEAFLDCQVPKYLKYNRTFPMEGVKWRKSSKKYKVKYYQNNKKHHARTRNIHKAARMLCDSWREQYKDKILSSYTTYYFKYKKRKYDNTLYFISYRGRNIKNWLFDIQHIISMVADSTYHTDELYNIFSDRIEYYILEKNTAHGYIKRELITLDVMCLILVSSKDFPLHIKSDLKKILKKLVK